MTGVQTCALPICEHKATPKFKRPDTPPPPTQFPSSGVLPVLTGVTRLANTPQEDTIAGLLDHLQLDSAAHNPLIEIGRASCRERV